MDEIKRPDGELARRPLYFFWIVDCSGSMYGEKIGILNNTVHECLPAMKDKADRINAQLLIRTLKFATGARWTTSSPVPIEAFVWDDLDAGGITDIGKAFELLAGQLSIPPMPTQALPPVLVLLTDGHPTDNYTKAYEALAELPWFKKSVRIGVSIGRDADEILLREFTGNPEYVLQANNTEDLAKAIKWTSTAPFLGCPPYTGVKKHQDNHDDSVDHDNDDIIPLLPDIPVGKPVDLSSFW